MIAHVITTQFLATCFTLDFDGARLILRHAQLVTIVKLPLARFLEPARNGAFAQARRHNQV